MQPHLVIDIYLLFIKLFTDMVVHDKGGLMTILIPVISQIFSTVIFAPMETL